MLASFGRNKSPWGCRVWGKRELFAKSPIPTPRGPIYFLAPEKGEEISWGGGELREDGDCFCLAEAGHEARAGWHSPPPPTAAPEADLCGDPCPAKNQQMEGICLSSLLK